MSEPLLKTRIHRIEYAAEDVLTFDLRPPGGDLLPPFTAGAHIDVHMPQGVARSYSLLNHAQERHRYLIGIKREAAGRGGSAWMHDAAKVGALIDISAPRNNFTLVEDAAHSVLVAGGIGITPMWCMVQSLAALGRPWTLHFRARSRSSAPLLHELAQPGIAEHVHLGFSDEGAGRRLDWTRLVAQAPEGSHFYCCGPNAMIEAFEGACADVPPERVHVEHFAAKQAAAVEGGFAVRLARSGHELTVEPGQSILESLRACGVVVPSSCQQGVCGACETRVLAGRPDHRDLVLSQAEKDSGKTMMICCSGSHSKELVLDI
ncbi:2Fe-2S iron-sulfur cluster-binding protein [Hydrogenophaga sp.]|uniref:PDR/VanB family oxidoreductase n=1 Tax=Hydrogenophaga sp. TaxID=1904254 RepID=UPI0035654E89